MRKRVLILAVLSASILTGCAQLGAAAALVNWYKVGAYACLRLSDTLNDKAEAKQAELDAAKAEEEPTEGAE